MKKYIAATIVGALALTTACQDNPAAPSVDRVVAGSQQTLQSLVTGIVQTDRGNRGGSYGTYGSIMARDAIIPNQNEQRTLTEFYVTSPDNSDFIGAAQWTGYYTLIRAGQNLLKDAAFTSLSASDQAATSGFVRTLQGLSYIRLIEYRDQHGVVVQGPDATVTDPIKTKASALTYASALLDSGYADLQAASATVPFAVPGGYKLHGDYSKTANLIKLNRGLKGKVEVMRALDPTAPNAASAANAVTALNIALADAPATVTQEYLNTGPWYQYQPSAPESSSNPLPGSSNLLTDNFVSSIMPGDLRANQFVAVSNPPVAGYSGSFRLKDTDPNDASLQSNPLQMVTNTEFFLLRAQAEIATNDLVGATRDINAVHTVEGGLSAYPTFTSASAAIDAVLYEYRYSFAYIGPQHIVALREYGKFDQAYVSQPGMPLTKVMVQDLPIPLGEVNSRGGDITPVP